MEFKARSDDQAAQAITRLVDGTLHESERAAVEAWAAADPDIAEQVVAQRRVVELLVASAPVPPHRLESAIEQRLASGARVSRARGTSGSGARGVARTPPTRRAPRRGWFSLAPVGALAAGAVAAVLILTGGSAPEPSMNVAAKLAMVPATSPAPPVGSSRYLDVSYGGVTFPNYGAMHATATGQLTNRIGGRAALTVFYRLRGGARLSYTVFSGRPVPLPAAARMVHYQGVELRVYRMSDGISVVTLVRHGRTCVLAARTAEDVVLGMAAEPVLVARA